MHLGDIARIWPILHQPFLASSYCRKEKRRRGRKEKERARQAGRHKIRRNTAFGGLGQFFTGNPALNLTPVFPETPRFDPYSMPNRIGTPGARAVCVRSKERSSVQSVDILSPCAVPRNSLLLLLSLPRGFLSSERKALCSPPEACWTAGGMCTVPRRFKRVGSSTMRDINEYFL